MELIPSVMKINAIQFGEKTEEQILRQNDPFLLVVTLGTNIVYLTHNFCPEFRWEVGSIDPYFGIFKKKIFASDNDLQ